MAPTKFKSSDPRRSYYVWARSPTGNSSKTLSRVYKKWILIHKGRMVRSPHVEFVDCCEEWKDSFENFYDWSIENGYNEKDSRLQILVRIPPDAKIYSPTTCKWVVRDWSTRTRPECIAAPTLASYQNLILSAHEWSTLLGLDYTVLRNKLHEFNGDIVKAYNSFSAFARRYRDVRTLDEAVDLYMTSD